MYGESKMENIQYKCKIDSQQEFANQWEFAVWLRELKLGFYNNLEGCDGEGGSRKVQEGGVIGIPNADSKSFILLHVNIQFY